MTGGGIQIVFKGSAKAKLVQFWADANNDEITPEQEEWLIEYVLTQCDELWDQEYDD